jgi:hypothetical protein
MIKCHLCQTKDADKTGSHIIPYFLIKRAINDDGKTTRDYEVSFEIATTTLVNQFFGRNVSPDRIENLLGREITQKEIEQNTSHWTRDNILCSACEKRLQIIETAFSEKIYSRKEAIFKPKSQIANLAYCDDHGGDSLIMRAFFLSIIWRISIVRLYKVALEQSVESKLRELLNSCLPYEASNLNSQLKSKELELKNLPMSLIYLKTPSDLVMQHPHAKAPYYYFLDEFIVLFYNKFKTTYAPLAHGFGLEQFPLKTIINFQESFFRVGMIEEKEANNIRSTIMRKIVAGISSTIKRNFQALFTHLIGYPAPTWYVNKMFQELTLDNSSNAYTQDRVYAVFKKYIDPHYIGR